MRALPLATILLLLCASFAWTADASCYSQPVHTYVPGPSAGANPASFLKDGFGTTGAVTVADSNEQDCDGDGVAGDWDGDYDVGVGGAFFGYGIWADEAVCSHQLNVHGPNVVVTDIFYNDRVFFVVGEDDQDGPVMHFDPVEGDWICLTDGIISPGDPTVDPLGDPNDCFSEVFRYGVGRTCGQGGGDGGFWVILLGAYVEEFPDAATRPQEPRLSLPAPDHPQTITWGMYPHDAQVDIDIAEAYLSHPVEGTIVAF